MWNDNDTHPPAKQSVHAATYLLFAEWNWLCHCIDCNCRHCVHKTNVIRWSGRIEVGMRYKLQNRVNGASAREWKSADNNTKSVCCTTCETNFRIEQENVITKNIFSETWMSAINEISMFFFHLPVSSGEDPTSVDYRRATNVRTLD